MAKRFAKGSGAKAPRSQKRDAGRKALVRGMRRGGRRK